MGMQELHEPLAQQTIFQHAAQVLRLSLGKGRNGGSACASGSQQLQNKLLVLASGNFFMRLILPTFTWAHSVQVAQCRPKSGLMLLQYKRNSAGMSHVAVHREDLLWQHHCSKMPPDIHVQTILLLLSANFNSDH